MAAREGNGALDAVWDLCRYTGRVGAMDVNTDSNARQRDNCNVDAHVTALHQVHAYSCIVLHMASYIHSATYIHT